MSNWPEIYDDLIRALEDKGVRAVGDSYEVRQLIRDALRDVYSGYDDGFGIGGGITGCCICSCHVLPKPVPLADTV